MGTDPPAPSSKYRLIRPLGTGGMGVVYLAHDTALKRDVALKFVAADRLSDPASRKRLVHEAQAAAALDHPAVCSVYDIELQPDGEACIVMQYVEGETLATKLQHGPMEVRQALTLIAEVTSGLAVAHKRGIIHRDLKPQNIMVTTAGRAKLLDFGIATLSDAIALSDSDTHTTSSTEGFDAGTPAYMSPEQIAKRPLDGRSDLFSLGCVLYECLTGRRAFEGRTSLEIYGLVLHVHPPPASSIRPELGPEHDELCRRLLAKDASDRFQSADELLGALRMLLSDTSIPTGVLPTTTRSRWRPRALAVVLMASAAVFGWWWSTRPISLPEAPPDAARWLEHGTNSIREGAYYSAKLALKQALAIHPQYPQAHMRLAEALIELDEGGDARDALLQANRLVDPTRLPTSDRARNDAIHALLLNDRDRAVSAYRRLTDHEPQNAGAWLDLARVQEAAGLRADARKSFERALTIDTQYPAAHLRLGALEAQEGRRAEALAAFAEAERLYRAASDVEGETEALLLRGAFLDSLGEVKDARAALERARTLASTTSNRFQTARADLRLSSVTATEGRFAESLKQAEQAVRAAREAGFDSVAADGLIELGATLMATQQLDAADAQLTEALAIARRQKAESLVLRATLNLASLRQTQGRPAEAVTFAQSTLDPLAARRDRRKVLSALAIMARAHEDLEQYPRAQEIARQLLSAAEEIHDEPHSAFAFESLATQATVSGHLPEALGYVTRAEAIHRRQADAAALPFDLANRADLLIRLGRGVEAESVLQEIEEGAARGVDAYVGRARRVLLLRAVNATVSQQFNEARRHATVLIGSGGSQTDSTGQMALALLRFVSARVDGPPPRRADRNDAGRSIARNTARNSVLAVGRGYGSWRWPADADRRPGRTREAACGTLGRARMAAGRARGGCSAPRRPHAGPGAA